MQDSSSLEALASDSPVALVGILSSLRVRPTRKGDLFASGVLEDMRGTAELLVFPQALQQLKDVLKPDAVLLIKGRVKQEENSSPKVVVSEAKPLRSVVNGGQPASGGSPELRLRIDLARASEKLAGELEDLLAAHPGKNPLVIELTRPGDFSVRLRPRRPPAVSADRELLARLCELCGEGAVFVGHEPAPSAR